MGIVTDEVRGLVSRQVQEHGVVVWFDPERHYADVLGLLGDGVGVVCYEDSFLKLRRTVDDQHLLEGETPPKLVVYVPMERGQTHDALIELTAGGVELYPGASARPRNTRLSVIARRALGSVLGEDGAAAVEKQVANGKLTLAELDRLAEQGQRVTSGAISLIFGTTNPLDVALAFLGSDQLDSALTSKEAIPELARLLGTAFDADLATAASPADLRDRFTRHVLVTDLLEGLGEAVPSALATLARAGSEAGKDACCTLSRTWRLRRDLQEGYAAWADAIEQSLALDGAQFSLEALAHTETFASLEAALQGTVEAALVKSANEGLVDLARTRQSSFWSSVRPAIQARWALVATAGQVVLEADRVASGLKGQSLSATDLFRTYTEGDRPWCLLDTAHRHMERRAQAFDFTPGVHQHLEALITRARQRYMSVGSDLAERFVGALAAAGYKLSSVPRQREVFKRYVAAAREHGKTAYVLVDALRFEMARELAQNLGEGFQATIEPVLGSLPSITEIGMAALMPKAESGVTLVQVAESKLALEIDGTTLKDRKDRVTFLTAHVPGQVFECKLEDLIPPKKATQAAIQTADFVLVTSQEIDALCEGDNVPLARRTMDDVLWELRRAFRVLLDLGVQTIVVSADHGYLFGDELDVDMKIDPPGGQTADLHRRVWVGLGGAASDSYVRLKASDVGLGGNLEIAVPWTFAGFKAGGASAYFHGGLAPQEIAVPVVVVRPAVRAVAAAKSIDWDLQPGSKKLSTRFFSVTVAGAFTKLFDEAIPSVRVEIRGKSGVLSTSVAASYGFEGGTGDVRLRMADGKDRELEPNTITLMLAEGITDATVQLYLLDATTGRELKRLGPIDVAITL